MTSRGPSGECHTARGKPPGQPLKIGENPIPALVPQAGQSIAEERIVIHWTALPDPRTDCFFCPATPFLEGFQPVCRGVIRYGERARR